MVPTARRPMPTSGQAAVESPVHDTPAATSRPPSDTPVAPEPEASVAEDAATAGQRPPRTFKFREDYVPAVEPVAGKTPRGPRIPDPPKAAGPAVRPHPQMQMRP